MIYWIYLKNLTNSMFGNFTYKKLNKDSLNTLRNDN